MHNIIIHILGLVGCIPEVGELRAIKAIDTLNGYFMRGGR